MRRCVFGCFVQRTCDPVLVSPSAASCPPARSFPHSSLVLPPPFPFFSLAAVDQALACQTGNLSLGLFPSFGPSLTGEWERKKAKKEEKLANPRGRPPCSFPFPSFLVHFLSCLGRAFLQIPSSLSVSPASPVSSVSSLALTAVLNAPFCRLPNPSAISSASYGGLLVPFFASNLLPTGTPTATALRLPYGPCVSVSCLSLPRRPAWFWRFIPFFFSSSCSLFFSFSLLSLVCHLPS